MYSKHKERKLLAVVFSDNISKSSAFFAIFAADVNKHSFFETVSHE